MNEWIELSEPMRMIRERVKKGSMFYVTFDYGCVCQFQCLCLYVYVSRYHYINEKTFFSELISEFDSLNAWFMQIGCDAVGFHIAFAYESASNDTTELKDENGTKEKNTFAE